MSMDPSMALVWANTAVTKSSGSKKKAFRNGKFLQAMVSVGFYTIKIKELFLGNVRKAKIYRYGSQHCQFPLCYRLKSAKRQVNYRVNTHLFSVDKFLSKA